jgi:hypothetical protein
MPYIAGVQYSQYSLLTDVQQILIVADIAGSQRSRMEMLHAERIVAIRTPALAAEAVDAAEVELVA